MAPLTIHRVGAPAPDVDAEFRPSVYLAFGRLMSRVCSVWFRFQMRGLEHVPAQPCMIVGNHSGIGIADVLCMLGAWRERFGLDRRAVGMMHDVFVSAPIVGWFARSFGAVRAAPAAAHEAVRRGHDVVVFPGGSIDSLRPFTAAREVRFGNRRGYVRLALARKLPIVPVATIGSHYSYLILPGGEAVGRALSSRRWSRDTSVPITVGAALVALAIGLAATSVISAWWIAAALVAAIVPTPVRITSRMLPPIDVCAATATIRDPAERIEHAHRLVEAALRDAVGTMEH